jgi:hypothetical protein
MTTSPLQRISHTRNVVTAGDKNTFLPSGIFDKYLLQQNIKLERTKGRHMRRKSFHRSTFVRHSATEEALRVQGKQTDSLPAKFCIMKDFYAYMPVLTKR